jgi:hypothetical protein
MFTAAVVSSVRKMADHRVAKDPLVEAAAWQPI